MTEQKRVHTKRIPGAEEGKWWADPDAVNALLRALGYPGLGWIRPLLTKFVVLEQN